MTAPAFAKSLWFEHVDGRRLYPWWRHARKRGQTALWVSDGSNLIEDADPIESIEALIQEVFARGRSVWLKSRGAPASTGLYRLGERVIRDWGADAALRPMIKAASQRAEHIAGGSEGAESARKKQRVSPEAVVAALQTTVSGLSGTEREALVTQRIGQSLFRDALLDLWEGSCAVSGLNLPELLRASHSKPWADCATDDERLDPFNGLLLAPHLDLLFDHGYLTFDEHGAALWSEAMTPQARAALGIVDAKLALRWIDPRHAPYLQYHRTHVFRDSGRLSNSSSQRNNHG